LEIKNLAATYKEVADKILPKLRRSEVWVKADSLSRPDEEIASLALSKPDTLTAEELLYAAAMTNDLSKKETIYKSFVQVYPNDWRGPNNVGFVHLLNNKVNDAKAEFEKASKITKNGIVLNNLGVCERLNGNAVAAMDYYKQASGAGPEVGENMGLVYIMWGDYTNSVSSFGSSQTFNAALAQLLNGNPDGALKTIDGSSDKSSAMGHYLKAVIGARKGDNNMVVENLKSATSKDASLKEKAKKDMEFAKLKNNAEFQAAVN
jgi:Tfp pilus assembly protein PilF